MMEVWNNTACAVGDFLLGWTLWLPRDVALVLLAVMSALLALALRRLSTNQHALRLMRDDLIQLRRLTRQTRSRGDRASLGRYRRTATAVRWLQLRQESRALLVSLAPLAILMTWASQRLEFLPPQSGETVTLTAWLPSSAAGGVAHLVPQTGLDASGGWIREIVPSRHADQPRGLATWQLRAYERPQAYGLVLRFRGRSVEHPLLVGQKTYLPPRRIHGEDFESQVELRPYRPLGLARIPWLPLPPWLTWFLGLTVLAYVVGRRWLSIA
jgi:hypothetical protein